MASRIPVNAITNLLLTTSLADTFYTVPAGSVFTVSACSLNNTTTGNVSVTANAFPSGGSASTANEVLSDLSVPLKPSAPVTVPALVGQNFPAGTTIQFKAGATGVSINLSGYLFTP